MDIKILLENFQSHIINGHIGRVKERHQQLLYANEDKNAIIELTRLHTPDEIPPEHDKYQDISICILIVDKFGYELIPGFYIILLFFL